MKKSIFRFFVDYEKEEQWINDMADQGWHLKRAFIGYFIFEQGPPGKYIYRNELIIGKSKDYFEFLTSMHIEYVTKNGAWAYYRKKAVEGTFELLSDHQSKLNYLRWVRNMMLVFAGFGIFAGCMNIVQEHILNKGIGLIDVLLVCLLGVPIIKTSKRIEKLQQEAQLFER